MFKQVKYSKMCLLKIQREREKDSESNKNLFS
jgi:hypothetical protein